MKEAEMLRNVRMMTEMFPEFIKAYAAAAADNRLDAWAKAIHSVIDLAAYDDGKADE